MSDPYERTKIPVEHKPRYFDVSRPIRWLCYAFLWCCWRSISATEKKWDGTQDKIRWSERSADDSTHMIILWGVYATIAFIAGGTAAAFGGPGAGLVIGLAGIVTCFFVAFVVKACFSLHKQEARTYWADRLLR